jgi:hypothetical protein
LVLKNQRFSDREKCSEMKSRVCNINMDWPLRMRWADHWQRQIGQPLERQSGFHLMDIKTLETDWKR